MAKSSKQEGGSVPFEDQAAGKFCMIFKQYIYRTTGKRRNGFVAIHLNCRTFTTLSRTSLKYGTVPTWALLGFRSQDKFYQQDRLLCILDEMLEDHSNLPHILPDLHKVLEDKKQAKR